MKHYKTLILIIILLLSLGIYHTLCWIDEYQKEIDLANAKRYEQLIGNVKKADDTAKIIIDSFDD